LVASDWRAQCWTIRYRTSSLSPTSGLVLCLLCIKSQTEIQEQERTGRISCYRLHPPTSTISSARSLAFVSIKRLQAPAQVQLPRWEAAASTKIAGGMPSALGCQLAFLPSSSSSSDRWYCWQRPRNAPVAWVAPPPTTTLLWVLASTLLHRGLQARRHKKYTIFALLLVSQVQECQETQY